VLKNVTITLTEEDLRWARLQAAEKGTSVSKLLGQMIAEERRRPNADYWAAYERWKKLKPIPGLDASKRPSREELHDRPSLRRHQRSAV
jgi:hypothetical protein